ncbi:MAG: hypothetical protein HN348_14035 [Proteobacteria bacterium]|jgi:hypothetical protein|nr:hypothetical protein [Pseudomonadota bacterium]
MLSILAMLVAAQLAPVEELTVIDGNLFVEDGAAQIEGAFEVTTCGVRECHTDVIEGTYELDLDDKRLEQLGKSVVPVVGGWLEVGVDGLVTDAELDVDGGMMDEGLLEALANSTDSEYGILIYIIYVGDDDDE